MRTVRLDKWNVSQYDDKSPFVLEAGTLHVHFILPDEKGQYFAVTATEKKPIKNGDVSLTVSEGVFNLTVKRYIDGQFKEAFAVEPLEIKSVDGEVTAFPQISLLQESEKELFEKTVAHAKEIKALSDALSVEQKQRSDETKNAINAIHTLALAFFSYAYTDYKNNVYTNNKALSEKEFLAVFGAENDFTDDEIKTMNKETLL